MGSDSVIVETVSPNSVMSAAEIMSMWLEEPVSAFTSSFLILPLRCSLS